jgi:RHS repeat-associated protein
MEKDDEVSGNNNQYTTEYRQYDPRIGRWTSLDPLMDLFPHQSGYAAFNNSPIYFADPTGLAGEDPIEGDPIKTNSKDRYQAFPANPENGQKVTFEFTDDQAKGDMQKFEYSQEQDKWLLKSTKDAGTDVWKDAHIEGMEDFGIAARHDIIGKDTQEMVEDIALGTSVTSGATIVAAKETIVETIKDTKHVSSGAKALKVVTKVAKRAALIGTILDAGMSLGDAYDSYEEGDTEGVVKGVTKATVSVISAVTSAAAYGAVGGGPVGRRHRRPPELPVLR